MTRRCDGVSHQSIQNCNLIDARSKTPPSPSSNLTYRRYFIDSVKLSGRSSLLATDFSRCNVRMNKSRSFEMHDIRSKKKAICVEQSRLKRQCEERTASHLDERRCNVDVNRQTPSIRMIKVCVYVASMNRCIIIIARWIFHDLFHW